MVCVSTEVKECQVGESAAADDQAAAAADKGAGFQTGDRVLNLPYFWFRLGIYSTETSKSLLVKLRRG
jgi:hypothetical protein